MLGSDSSEDVRLYCITALRTIGGPVAAEALRRAAADGSEAVREAAIGAIEELVTGGRVDDTESLPLSRTGAVSADRSEDSEAATVGPIRVRGAVRTRGAIRTRGGCSGKAGPRMLEDITQTLEQIRTEEGASEYLRYRAGEVLDYLKK
jgi:hypothetical protein